MIDYSTNPIDIVDDDGNWVSTFRYEPYLKKWFYIEPTMKGTVRLVDEADVPQEILSIADKEETCYKNAYQAPLKLQIQLNTSCNYKCKMCYVSPELQNQSLSLQTLEKLFIEAKNIGVVRINFVGGEIFMRKDIKEIIALAQQNNLLTSCITNGIIPGKNINNYKSLLESMYMVQISCNGIGKSYNDEHGLVCWDYAKDCIANVVHAVKASILSYVITDENVDDIPRFIEYATEIKPTIIKFGTVCWSGKSFNKGTMSYYSATLEKAKQYIKAARKQHPELQIQSQIDAGEETPLWEDYSNGYRPYEFYFSPESRDGLYLNAIEKYYPFPLLSDNPNFCLGKISDGLLNIWKTNSILQELRSVRFEDTACGKLGCSKPCGLWNRSYAIAWSGNIYGKVPCKLTNWT